MKIVDKLNIREAVKYDGTEKSKAEVKAFVKKYFGARVIDDSDRIQKITGGMLTEVPIFLHIGEFIIDSGNQKFPYPTHCNQSFFDNLYFEIK